MHFVQWRLKTNQNGCEDSQLFLGIFNFVNTEFKENCKKRSEVNLL